MSCILATSIPPRTNTASAASRLRVLVSVGTCLDGLTIWSNGGKRGAAFGPSYFRGFFKIWPPASQSAGLGLTVCGGPALIPLGRERCVTAMGGASCERMRQGSRPPARWPIPMRQEQALDFTCQNHVAAGAHDWYVVSVCEGNRRRSAAIPSTEFENAVQDLFAHCALFSSALDDCAASVHRCAGGRRRP